ncbi:Methuselah N-terminal domain [Trinorchestia longiramus]|nr:Methuselah N-terminal domain [Trinorchestia longiramus]
MVLTIGTALIIALVTIQNASFIKAHNTNSTGNTEGTLYMNIDTESNFYTYDVVSNRDVIQTEQLDETQVCETSTCVRKCCTEGKYFSLYPEYGCFTLGEEDPQFELEFRRENGWPSTPEKPVHLLYWTDFKNCSAYGLLPEHREAVLLSDGRLYTAYEDMYRDTGKYCIDVMRRDNKKFSMWVITCYDKYQEVTRSLFQIYLHVICLVLSSVSLLVIIVCHVAVPKLRDLSGLCLLSHVSSLFIADICLVTVTLDRNISLDLCVFLGVTIHSSLLSTYMWLTVMCFDIWRYVRMSVKGIPSNILQLQEKRLFVYYCMLVWGSILVITIITCTLQFLPPDALPDYVVRPLFGVNRCFIIVGSRRSEQCGTGAMDDRRRGHEPSSLLLLAAGCAVCSQCILREQDHPLPLWRRGEDMLSAERRFANRTSSIQQQVPRCVLAAPADVRDDDCRLDDRSSVLENPTEEHVGCNRPFEHATRGHPSRDFHAFEEEEKTHSVEGSKHPWPDTNHRTQSGTQSVSEVTINSQQSTELE